MARSVKAGRSRRAIGGNGLAVAIASQIGMAAGKNLSSSAVPWRRFGGRPEGRDGRGKIVGTKRVITRHAIKGPIYVIEEDGRRNRAVSLCRVTADGYGRVVTRRGDSEANVEGIAPLAVIVFIRAPKGILAQGEVRSAPIMALTGCDNEPEENRRVIFLF